MDFQWPQRRSGRKSPTNLVEISWYCNAHDGERILKQVSTVVAVTLAVAVPPPRAANEPGRLGFQIQ